MPKNIEEIIVPDKKLNRKSIRNIPIPENRVRAEVPPTPTTHSHLSTSERITIHKIKTSEKETPKEFVFKQKTNYFKSPLNSRKFIISASVVGIILVVFSLLSIFKSASLTYTPKIYNLTFNKDSF